MNNHKMIKYIYISTFFIKNVGLYGSTFFIKNVGLALNIFIKNVSLALNFFIKKCWPCAQLF